MPRFVFWNVNRAEIAEAVARLAWQEDADVVVLAECAMEPAKLLWAMNERRPDFHFAPGRVPAPFLEESGGRLAFYTRFSPNMLTPIVESHRVSIRRLEMMARRPILLAVAHLPSKRNYRDESQVFESVHLARMIEQAERQEGHQRTVVMGDLNMNPFESGMVAASGGLHAVMSRRVAERGSRVVQREPYTFFYNPMWNHMGDWAEAAGTYYYENGEPLCYFWNMFDQVLLRPELLGGFKPEGVRIVTEIDGRPLMKNGCPVVSDHLPVVLEVGF